jgi:addiction module RelE/StbE family toxin
MIIRFHKHFKKAYQKLPSNLQVTVDAKLELFYKEPFAVELNNHQLKGRYENYRSINITGDYRAVYKLLSEKEVIFVKIGTHSSLY